MNGTHRRPRSLEFVGSGRSGAAEGDSESPLPLPLTYVCSSWATLDLTMCAACKPSTLSPPSSLLAPFAVSVGNGLNIALHSRTLKSRNDRSKPTEEPTNEQGRGDGGAAAVRASSVRPSFPPPPPAAVCLVERGKSEKVKLGTTAATASEMSDSRRPPREFLIALASF